MLASANEQGLAVIPRGGGTKMDWGNPPARADVLLSTARLNRVIEHAWGDMTATVEAGCTVAQLQKTLAEHGQHLAIDTLWPERATIGGILATNDSGALRLRYGALRDLIIGVTVALPDGTMAMSGGKVVKNVAGYDLPKLMTGALGTLGVITQAVFRLYPLSKLIRPLTLCPQDATTAQRLMLAIQNSQLAHSALQLRASSTSPLKLDLLLEGTAAGIAAQESQIREMAGSTPVNEPTSDVWAAREQLWPCSDDAGIAKFSVLPTQWAETIQLIERSARGPWAAVLQATGLGCVRAQMDWQSLRATLESKGGSLVILTPPAAPASSIDAWGSVGDTGPIMRALKHQFDPKGTLNPGRFAGGI
jgi:glycolate oxidase FAD binding subunit